jgi:TonB family protein
VLLRDGSIGGVSLAESSGADMLDDAAMEAVRRVAQFPPFPGGLGRRDWVVTVPIRYSLM